MEHDPFIRSQLASRNQLEGLMWYTFGHDTVDSSTQRNPGVPPNSLVRQAHQQPATAYSTSEGFECFVHRMTLEVFRTGGEFAIFEMRVGGGREGASSEAASTARCLDASQPAKSGPPNPPRPSCSALAAISGPFKTFRAQGTGSYLFCWESNPENTTGIVSQT